ncbi:MAG: type II secretion system F family protein [Gammaproteobacteria bacterium]
MEGARKSYLNDRRNTCGNRTSQTDLSKRQLYFSALAQGLSAGLTPAQSIATVIGDVKGAEAKILKSLKADLDRGRSVTEVFGRYRLANDFDLALLEIGESAGRLATIVGSLAARYQQSIKRTRQLKSGLRLPLLIALIAVIVMPVPAVVAGRLDPFQYLLAVIIIVLAGVVGWQLLRYLFNRLASTPTGYPAHPFIDLPLIGSLLMDFSRANFLERLNLLFASGYPIIEAIERSHESLVGFARRRRYKQLASDLHSGYGLADSFQHHEVLTSHQLSILVAGEGAGRMDDALSRVALDARQSLDNKLDAISTWFPRVVYVWLTIVIALQLV